MFYAVIEYLLTLDPYKEINKRIFPDSRMKTEFGQMVKHFGGIAKIHPKGHSKVKATMDLLLRRLAKEAGSPNIEDFLVKHPGFRIVQAEYSLHFFLTNEKGEAFDDAIEFAFYWLSVFSKLKLSKKQPDWTYPDYVKNLKDTGVVQESVQLKEQRTPMPDDAKGAVMDDMRDTVIRYFEQRGDFEYQNNWEADFEAEMKPYTLVNVEGVYHLFTPLGEIFWGQSNTSPKVAFGTQSTSLENTKKLAAIAARLFTDSRERIEKKMATKLPFIDPLETASLMTMFNVPKDGNRGEQLESHIRQLYPEIEQALDEFSRTELRAKPAPSLRKSIEITLQKALKRLPAEISDEDRETLFGFADILNFADPEQLTPVYRRIADQLDRLFGKESRHPAIKPLDRALLLLQELGTAIEAGVWHGDSQPLTVHEATFEFANDLALVDASASSVAFSRLDSSSAIADVVVVDWSLAPELPVLQASFDLGVKSVPIGVLARSEEDRQVIQDYNTRLGLTGKEAIIAEVSLDLLVAKLEEAARGLGQAQGRTVKVLGLYGDPTSSFAEELKQRDYESRLINQKDLKFMTESTGLSDLRAEVRAWFAVRSAA